MDWDFRLFLFVVSWTHRFSYSIQFFSSLGFGKEFLTSLPKMDTLSWSNIDPQALLDELSEILDLDNFNSFFHRVSICFAKLCIDVE